MNISYSCNDFYIPQTGISMISLFENNKDVDSICVYLIATNVSEKNSKQLKAIADAYGRQFVCVDFDDIAYDLKLSDTGRHIATVYTKVFFSRLNGVDKMIYLDSDTVVVGSLKELWEEDFSDVYMGVVETFPSKHYKELGLPPNDRFFNDGMAICNVSYCRKNNLIGKVLKVVEDFNGNPPTLSEGALNKVCYGKVKYISPRYNLLSGILYSCNLNSKFLSSVLHYSEGELIDSCSHPVVIHYLSSFYNRPWFKGCCHPFKEEFYKYKSISPWKDMPLLSKPLPLKLKMVDVCNKLFGLKNTTYIRKLFSYIRIST